MSEDTTRHGRHVSSETPDEPAYPNTTAATPASDGRQPQRDTQPPASGDRQPPDMRPPVSYQPPAQTPPPTQTASPAPPTMGASPAPPQPPKKRHRGLIIGIVVVVIVVVALVVCLVCLGGDDTASEDDTTALQNSGGSSTTVDGDAEEDEEEVTAYDPSGANVSQETDYEGWHIAVLDDATAGTDSSGDSVYSVTLEITNNTGESGDVDATSIDLLVGHDLLDMESWQNGIQLDHVTYSSITEDSNLYDRALLADKYNNSTIQDGTTVDIPVFFELDDDSEVTFQIIDDWNDDATLLETTYTFAM